MGHAYTPGLTVSERMVVRKRRQLPIPGSVLVQVDDEVRANAVVARAELPGGVHTVNVANILGVAPDEILDYLSKNKGEAVEKGEVIAENKPLIKWFKTEVRSPIKGSVESASTLTGQMLLREPPRHLELLAYVDGTIVEMTPAQGVSVETQCAMVQGIFGVGGETWGDLALAVNAPDELVTPTHFRPDMRGKIVVCGSFLGADSMKRAKELELAGLVVGGIHDKDLRGVLGYDLGVAITGTERIGFTLVLTEGFGTIPMARQTFDLLSRHVGQKASISGATQIRAGVIRPEIIIPHPKGNQAHATRSHGQGPAERAGIQIGDLARVIRDPLFGRIGTVAGLPTDLRRIETESEVRVLEIDLGNGTVATIPRANIEIIEEG